jgi:hypothetical protein
VRPPNSSAFSSPSSWPTLVLYHAQFVHGHVLVMQQWVAVGIVFLGLTLEVVDSEFEKRSGKHHHSRGHGHGEGHAHVDAHNAERPDAASAASAATDPSGATVGSNELMTGVSQSDAKGATTVHLGADGAAAR